ncbi:Hypothetical predicted protein [Marmota monax]|uniref:Uncharacterized protein n=1 Tax=Marmota monax TaxID=9995 RepID=A0A5E4AQI1_MARMO|nr:Hypothetical predicted protein [Marmota monax]
MESPGLAGTVGQCRWRLQSATGLEEAFVHRNCPTHRALGSAPGLCCILPSPCASDALWRQQGGGVWAKVQTGPSPRILKEGKRQGAASTSCRGRSSRAADSPASSPDTSSTPLYLTTLASLGSKKDLSTAPTHLEPGGSRPGVNPTHLP